MKNLNKKFILTCLGGDEEIYELLAIEFFEQTKQRNQYLLDAIKSKDFEKISREAHTIKGLFSTFGANNFAETTRKLELLAKENNLEKIIELYPEVVDCNNILSEEIKNDLNL